MSIVTLDNFNSGILFIPNNRPKNAGGDNSNVQNSLQLFIDVFERELLINALGITLYEEFEDELPNPTTQKWIDLLNGKTYSINGKSYRWDGLTGANGQSLIAYYVYCQYLRNDQSIYTTAGVVLPDASNSQNADPTPKYISAYNRFIDSYQGDYNHNNNGSNNPNIIINNFGMIGLDYYGSRNNNFSNLYQYLTDQNTLNNPEPFPDFEFTFYHRENSWGV